MSPLPVCDYDPRFEKGELDQFIVIRLIILLGLLILSGFFSGSETALFSLSKIQTERIKLEKGKKGERIWNLLSHPRRLIISILIGNELVNVSISIIGTSILVHMYGNVGKYMAILLVTSLVLILGEIIPKSLAIRNSERFALRVSSPLTAFSTAIFPLRRLIRYIIDALLGHIEKKLPQNRVGISEDEFRTLVNIGREEGVILEDEKELIEKVFEFGDANVSEVMTPRTDIFALDIANDMDQALSRIKDNIYSRIPAYEGNIDELRGVISLKELLYHSRLGGKDVALADLILPPFIVPETKKISELFQEFRQGMTHLAMVIDEYGGVAGLVTLEDLLEEIVGEIMDEYDKGEQDIYALGRQVYQVSAMMTLDDFNLKLGTNFEDSRLETVGGYVLHLFGKVPADGEKIEADGVTFTVDMMKGLRIIKLLVEKKGG